MDLEAYISAYTGPTRATRLQFIARTSPELRSDAIRLLFQELRSGNNITKFKDAWAEFNNEEIGFDAATTAWLAEKEKTFHEKLSNLNQLKSLGSKDNTRIVFQDLGHLYLEAGDLQNAFESFSKMRENCSTSNHLTNACLQIIHVCCEMNQFQPIGGHASKMESTCDVADKSLMASARASSGLFFLHATNYRMAASKFLDCTVDVNGTFNFVMTGADVATYAVLCALATYDRSDLRTHVLEKQSFRSLLELVPNVREILNSFYESRYSSCLHALEKLRATLQLDLYISPHISTLIADIRRKAMIQYIYPFSSVVLDHMATNFATTRPVLETELCDLIANKKIRAVIDAVDGILYSREEDPSVATFEKLTALSNKYERNTIALLFRAQCVRCHLSLRPTREWFGHDSTVDDTR
eukprot:c9249_g1_i1.p1 GENE.c9249_g1_i1~~c9249_g1_i1.p1  ORF type:complete len:430 (-),score=110.66 c9249_g1_i1:57-1295(-)